MLCIDAGHGGADSGCVANGLLEKDLALDMALALRASLVACGLDASLTRESDARMRLSQRGARAQAVGAAQVICLHFDTHANPAVGRFTCYCAGEDTQSRSLAATFAQTMPAWLNAARQAIVVEPEGWKRRAYNVVTAFPRIPTLLIECGFLSNARHAQLLGQSAGRASLLGGLVAGWAAQGLLHAR